MQDTLYQIVKTTSSGVIDGRTTQQVAIKTMEEVGEMCCEILIADGITVNKTQGVDGVVGEAVDAIITLLDIIHVHAPNLTENDLVEIAKRKCSKWLATR